MIWGNNNSSNCADMAFHLFDEVLPVKVNFNYPVAKSQNLIILSVDPVAKY